MATIELSNPGQGLRTLRLTGNLTLEDAAPLRDKLVEVLADPHPPLIDLCQLQDCHPLCLGVLLSFANTLAEESNAKARLMVSQETPGVWFQGMLHAAITVEVRDA